MTPTLPGLSHHRVHVNGTELITSRWAPAPSFCSCTAFPSSGGPGAMSIPSLAPSFRVVAPDLRGYHLSAKPASGYDLATLAGDVAALVEHLGTPAMIAAHDWGGVVAYQTAMTIPAQSSGSRS